MPNDEAKVFSCRFALGRHFFLALCVPFLAPWLKAQPVPMSTMVQSAATNEVVLLPESVPDPIEPFNRVMWAFNKELLTYLVQPTSKVYRGVVVKPVRKSIADFARNLTYPPRLLNNLLVGNWGGARDESYRFLCNSTVGLGGFLDVATKWKIPKAEADFGQTLGHWGWEPGLFLMLPFAGPSSERDTLGMAVDAAVNPLNYLSPYDFQESRPLTYLSPYGYFGAFAGYNQLTDGVDEYVRLSQSEADPYSTIQYASGFQRKNRVADFSPKGPKDESSLETLQAVFFTFRDPKFPGLSRTRSVTIPATKMSLRFTYWLQRGQASMVYIVPGLGGHRLSQASLALAELLYNNGFSAVLISSPFNAEFMENASTAALPAYLPVDGHDLQVALTEIDHRLEALFPNRLGKRALAGYSMGAFDSLYLAANEAVADPKLVRFERYVAINTPVRLMYGISKLDEFFQAPAGWASSERTDNLENTFLKVATLTQNSLRPQTTLPFSAIESEFLIGLSFRYTLRDVIYSSQRRNNQGVLQHSIRNLNRGALYQEILRYSYRDYFEKLVVPYYRENGLGADAAATLARAGDLRTYEAGLRANPKVRIIANQNDFLLEEADLAWLRATFGAELTSFEKGGHLGNLSNDVVQEAILNALAPIRAR